MCGINGFNFNNSLLIKRMNEKLRHRGPNQEGFFVDNNISLGQTRLSIIDLSEKAKQPIFNENKSMAVVANGEIYNYQQIKKDLEAKGHRFYSQSDTEVIVHAYEEYGSECLKFFNGIFAFAIWDKKKREIFLARDHIGAKPLYYFLDKKVFIFSSEIKAILEHNIPRVLDIEAFNHYLRVLYAPEPLTMFKNIMKFPPASFGVFKNNGLKITNYWDIEKNDYLNKPEDFLKKELRKKITEATKRQIVFNKPLGIYLSGGIDSSAILHSAAQLRDKINTFSVGFELGLGEQKEKFNKDLELARKTAKHYGTKHSEIFISPSDVLSLFEKSVWHMDEPISNPTAISMMKLANFSKNKVDIVLGGDGGDELFGGYKRYQLSLLASYYQKLPQSLRKIFNFNENFRKLNISNNIDRFALFMFQKDNILKRVVNDEFLSSTISKDFFNKKYFSNNNFKTFEEQLMDVNRRSWLVDESFMMTDKMSMSASLEARVPLLDKDLVEFASKIPLKYKVNLFNTKIILKNAFKGRIPDFIFNQPKRGWFSPAAKWLRYPKIYNMAKDILSDNYYKETNSLFKWDEFQKVLDAHRSKEEYNLNIIWSILTFQVWARQYNVII